MNLQDYLNQAVKAKRKDSFDRSDQLTLGEIILKCEAIDKSRDKGQDEPEVCFDFEYLFPVGIGSWRGSYAELALWFSDSEYHSEKKTEPMKLGEFIKMLRSAVGKTFTGWKGGEYEMTKNTPVWVANPGNSGETAVIEVVDASYKVILITGYREY